jgi:hypothetical protein
MKQRIDKGDDKLVSEETSVTWPVGTEFCQKPWEFERGPQTLNENVVLTGSLISA